MKDFDIDFQTDFSVTKQGYLMPKIYDATLAVGETYFYHDDWLIAFLMHQLVEITLVVMENSVYYLGTMFLNGVMEPVITHMLNKYTMDVPIENPFKGQVGASDFNFDFRHVSKPMIEAGYMDLFIYGRITYDNQLCAMSPTPQSFIESRKEGVFSQIVFTDAAATCIMQAFGNSEIGKLNLNQDKMNELFERDDIVLTSTALADQLPIFKEKLGEDQPLRVELSFDNMQVNYGINNNDVNVAYTMKIGFHLDLPTKLGG